MKPTNGASFGDVCAFTIACVEAGKCFISYFFGLYVNDC